MVWHFINGTEATKKDELINPTQSQLTEATGNAYLLIYNNWSKYNGNTAKITFDLCPWYECSKGMEIWNEAMSDLSDKLENSIVKLKETQ